MRFLFWNIQKKDSFFETIADICVEHSIDVLGLAEFPKDKANDLISAFKFKGLDISFVENVKYKVAVFHRIGANIYNKFEGEFVCALEAMINGIPYSIVFCHLHSKNMASDDDTTNRARFFCEDLVDYENNIVSHCRTIVAGDFNMNPYDSGMISASAFNAMNSISVSKRGERQLMGKSFRFFYNPTWNLHGDKGKETPAASYYYDKADFDQYYWHMLDQVIIRPEVIPHFIFDDFRILYKGANYNLVLDDNRINETEYSDHLPISFTIK